MLDPWSKFLKWEQLLELREAQLQNLVRITHWDQHRNRLEDYPFADLKGIKLDLDRIVSIRTTEEQEQELLSKTEPLIRGLLPWRKGPFNVLGFEIDAEWQSDMKWSRMVPFLPALENHRIADIGCNNGYYMLRLLQYNPQLVVGLDPSSRCYYQFDLFQRLLQDKRIHYEPLGVEHLEVFPNFFHVAFCLGVIYHRRDPYSSCKMLFNTLKSGGTLFFESLTVPGDKPQALCVPERYAKMRNVWYVPTVACMKVWLTKAGFVDIVHVSTDTVTSEEQRQTELAPYESLKDFLDPEDPSKTVEGFPAPVRTVLMAKKAKITTRTAMASYTVLNDSELSDALKELPGWSITDGKLAATYTFQNFRDAFGFMTQIAIEAEVLDHHPEWSNIYNRVSFQLCTHDAGDRITDLDTRLAKYVCETQLKRC